MRRVLISLLAGVVPFAAAAQGLPPFQQAPVLQPSPSSPPPTPVAQGRVGENPSAAAPMPSQPSGGFVPLQGPASDDAARRMNLNGAPDYMKTLQTDAANRIGDMGRGVVGGAAPQPGGPVRLDMAPVANQADLEGQQQTQREIVILQQQVTKAKLLVDLWGILYNNENAKALREREAKEREQEAKEREQRQAAERMTSMTAAQAALAVRPPVMAAPPAVPPQVVSVNGGRVTLLVPGTGETFAVRGQKVGQFRITSVSGRAVKAVGPAGEITLPFGETVSSPAPQVFPQAGALPGGIPSPVANPALSPANLSRAYNPAPRL